MGFRKGNFPCKYLGIPIDKDTRSRKVWETLLTKIDTKMENWKGKWLSNA